MPRTRSLAWAELKFGLIAVFALVMAALLIFAVGGGGGFFWQNYPLKVQFPNVAGLMSGSPVRVAGVEVGSVTDVQLVPSGAEVSFTVLEELREVITDRSTAKIGSISLLGEGAVDIEAAPGGTPIPDWGYVATGKPAPTIAELTEQAGTGIADVTAIFADLRAGKGTVGKLLTDEAVYRDFNNLISAADRVAQNVASGKGTMGKLANDPKVYDELNASVANLNAITTKLKNGEGSLGQLLNDPALAKSLNATTSNLESMTGKLNRGEGTAGKLLTDDALYKRMDSLTARLDTVLQNLNNGEGTAGQLLHDKQLYENMNQTVAEMRALIAEIKKDPKKYLNVKVSIFEARSARRSTENTEDTVAKDNSGSLMVAFVVGALTGAAVALLFAPATGEETREFLGQKARDGKAKAREAMDQGRDYYRSQRDNLVTAVERGREAFQQARERGDQV